jgi:hypothetical protein
MNTAARVRAAFAVEDVEQRKRSATAAMQALLDADIRPDDRRYLLDMALWRYTEFDKNRHKFSIRYRTAAVFTGPPTEINHEHVVERRWLLDRITSRPERLEEYLQLAVACIVTRDEHILLSANTAFGWERYLRAGLQVMDTLTLAPLDLGAAAEAQCVLLRGLGEPANDRSWAIRETPSPDWADPQARGNPIQGASPRQEASAGTCSSGVPPSDVGSALCALSGRNPARAPLHAGVHAALLAAGYVARLPTGSGSANYLSYIDPATGRNFVNLTATVAHLMRGDLRRRLASELGVRMDKRYPQVHLDQPDAVGILRRLAVRFKS